jgi:hypothetical protein
MTVVLDKLTLKLGLHFSPRPRSQRKSGLVGPVNSRVKNNR